MNIRHLLQQRSQLLRQTRLANVAYAYARLEDFGARIARAGLRGTVTLHPADPSVDRLLPEFTSNAIAESRLEEHFLDKDLAELADLLAFVCEDRQPTAHTFRVESLADQLRPGLRAELEAAGVRVEEAHASPAQDPLRSTSRGEETL
jgi:hypothetical protein